MLFCFRSYYEFLGTRHRDLLPPRVSPIQFVVVSSRGWEGGVKVFLYSGSNICKHSSSEPLGLNLGVIHRRGQEHPSGYHLRNQHDSDEARKPGDHRHWSQAFELGRRKPCGRTWGRRVSVKYALWVAILRMSRGNEISEETVICKERGFKVIEYLFPVVSYLYETF